MQLPFSFLVRQKPVGALDLIFLLVVLVGRFGREVSVGVFFFFFFFFLVTSLLFLPLAGCLLALAELNF